MNDATSTDSSFVRADCPRCGRSDGVEELGAASGTLWLHCDFCGHLWRRLEPSMDAFSLIVGSRSASAQPIMEANTDSATASRGSRAPRFSVQLAMKYRPHGDSTWRSAMTENISRSGVLFRAADDVDPQTPIELLLVLPGAVSGEPPSRLRCDGRVVRSTTCHGAERQSCLAAAIDDYRLATV